jgi:hypothetical protein
VQLNKTFQILGEEKSCSFLVKIGKVPFYLDFSSKLMLTLVRGGVAGARANPKKKRCTYFWGAMIPQSY